MKICQWVKGSLCAIKVQWKDKMKDDFDYVLILSKNLPAGTVSIHSHTCSSE